MSSYTPKTFLCRVCGHEKPGDEFRPLGGYGHGSVPATCNACRVAGRHWCSLHEAEHPLEEFDVRGSTDTRPKAVCRRGIVERNQATHARRQPRHAPKVFLCRVCETEKLGEDFRVAGAYKCGPVQNSCNACRAVGRHWCTFHNAVHLVEEFDPRSDADPVLRTICRRGLAERQWIKRGGRMHECLACGIAQPPPAFPHVSKGYAVCAKCRDGHTSQRWCRACGWQPESRFTYAVRAGEAHGHCDQCRQAWRHGTTVAAVCEIQGVDTPACEACGTTEDLVIDHDHGCCPGGSSCGACVRGYLCRNHNIAEGILGTAESALQLAAVMLAREAQYAALMDDDPFERLMQSVGVPGGVGAVPSGPGSGVALPPDVSAPGVGGPDGPSRI